LAYAAFRLGWCKMAAASVRGTDDEARLFHEYRRKYNLLSGSIRNLAPKC
jgi:hypothetical protein